MTALPICKSLTPTRLNKQLIFKQKYRNPFGLWYFCFLQKKYCNLSKSMYNNHKKCRLFVKTHNSLSQLFHKKTPIVRGGETRFIVGVSHAKLTKWRVTLAVKISTSFVHHNRGGRDRQDRIFYETEKENQSKYRMGWFFFVTTKLYRQIVHKKTCTICRFFCLWQLGVFAFF